MMFQGSRSLLLCLYAINTILMVLSVAVEKKSFLRSVRSTIEDRKSLIDQEVYIKLLVGIAEGNCIVAQQGSRLFRYLPVGVDSPSGLHLIGRQGAYRHISFSEIPRLDPNVRYFFIDANDILVLRMFLERGLHSFIYTGSFGFGFSRDGINQMLMISQECLGILDRVGYMETDVEDMEIKLRKGRPDELLINHPQGLFVMKSMFKYRNEFLEDLKTHFTDFMNSILPGMRVSSFCSTYVKSVIGYLERRGILVSTPPIKEYPELIHYLFPYRVVPDVPNLSDEELVVGGISLDGVLQNDYLKDLFNPEQVERIVKNGSRFIFTSHISADGRKRKYGVSFV
ncbi:hypothetical protein [Encephalitozoon cuniculi GB-M1]|uniref:Uncharacterized protein n=1 Tax=Encephalitozoon cuniculi (strain GB-M1) TaxID=284813 RepID=Q8SWF2_ENCCU|nr:uncharacterized protein ECU02_0370 [Encephalitozoon cuniculi GB-M1]CAD25068.1 hypothetical protein [Encephalitozoon cuniculi GB-M1]